MVEPLTPSEKRTRGYRTGEIGTGNEGHRGKGKSE